MWCWGPSGTDSIIIIILFFMTCYSMYSCYTFLFGEVLYALELAFLQPFGLGVERPVSSSPFHLRYLFDVPVDVWALFGVSTFLFLIAVWAYVAAMVTDAGRVPEAFRQRAPTSTSLALNAFGELKVCPFCATYKPQRAHHCSRCKRCVLKYDHHCPWLGRCVGFLNYKLYLLVVLYTFIFTLWVTVLLLMGIILYVAEHYRFAGWTIVHRSGVPSPVWRDGKCWSRLFTLKGSGSHAKTNSSTGKGNFLSTRITDGLGFCPPFLGVYICLLEALVFLLLTGSLLRKHWFLARHNLTTLDIVIYQNQLDEGNFVSPLVNPYDIGVKGCLHQVFGDGDEQGMHIHPNFCARWFFRLLPFPAYPKQTDLSSNSPIRNAGRGNSLRDGAFTAASYSSVPIPNYGTSGEGAKQYNRGRRGAGSSDVGPRNKYSQFPFQSPGYTGDLLGLRFPTVTTSATTTTTTSGRSRIP